MNILGFRQNEWRSSRILAFSMLGLAAMIAALWIFGGSVLALYRLGLVTIPILIIGHLAYKAHLRALEQNTHQITEASRVHLATVEALATAIDARDQVGIGHARRTQIFAVGIGHALGLGESEIGALRTGALLHDIGKLAVPDHILNKPGRLTPAEMEKTKTHAAVGASILETVAFPYPVVPTVKYHHECWDGSGYPEGLQGNKIPLTARILSVADAYDTLRGHRPYRPAVSRDEACKYLRAAAGSQLDPAIVDLFLRNLKTFEEAIESQGLIYDLDENTAHQSTRAAPGLLGLTYVEQIKRANREVFTLYSLAREFSAALSLERTVSLLTDKVRELVPFDTCLIYLMDESGEFATAVHAEGQFGKTLEGRRIKIGEGVTGYVLKKSKPLENVDPSADFADLGADIARSYKAMAAVPLIANEDIIGAISLYSMELPEYQDEHLRLLETVSRIAADALRKSIRHAETENIALTDPMTGLPNARSMQIQFEREAKRADRSGNSFHLLILDLDSFKEVNDTYGHKVGDRMLKEISDVIRRQLRDYDFLARYGGDEFVAVVPETDDEGVKELSGRIEEAVKTFVLRVGEDSFAKVGVSIGAASYPGSGETFDQVVIAADKAMYLAKAAHKERAARQNEDALRAAAVAAGGSPLSRGQAGNLEEYYLDGDSGAVQIVDGAIMELDESNIILSAAVN